MKCIRPKPIGSETRQLFPKLDSMSGFVFVVFSTNGTRTNLEKSLRDICISPMHVVCQANGGKKVQKTKGFCSWANLPSRRMRDQTHAIVCYVESDKKRNKESRK